MSAKITVTNGERIYTLIIKYGVFPEDLKRLGLRRVIKISSDRSSSTVVLPSPVADNLVVKKIGDVDEMHGNFEVGVGDMVEPRAYEISLPGNSVTFTNRIGTKAVKVEHLGE